jgi:hypothetical protein
MNTLYQHLAGESLSDALRALKPGSKPVRRMPISAPRLCSF